MSTALLAISDGRDTYHLQSQESAKLALPRFDHTIWVDDREHELGFGGAIREGWRRVLETDAEFIFHLELDFTFARRVPVRQMIRLLERHPRLAQVALLRQPVNEQEKAAGSLYELLRGHLVPCADLIGNVVFWLEHKRNFTTNPSVYPRWVAERGWPDEDESEGKFGIYLLQDKPEASFAYWGRGEEWCEHIGHNRTGTGY